MKKCVDSFAEKKKFHIVWIVLEDSSAGTFENFFWMMHVRKAVFVIRRLLVSEEKFVWSSEEKGVTYVCLRCVVSSPSVARYIKVG